MRIQILDAKSMAKVAYQHIHTAVTTLDHPVLGLATGTTPIELYALMVESYTLGTSYAHVSTYNLDEYVGIDGDNVNSYRYFMNSYLFDHIDIDKHNTHVPSGMGDMHEQCDSYNAMLDSITVDVQILGIGVNGHIAFNEPGTPWDSVTHVVELSSSTIEANARLFDDIQDVPCRAISMGLANIIKAKQIIVMATGSAKAQAVYDMVHGKQDTLCPASILQTHDNVLLLCDEQAGALLQ